MSKTNDEGRRVSKVEREVQQAVARFLLSDLKGELPGLVTVSRVQMPADLKSARVFITVIATDGENEAELRDEAVDLLQHFAPEIQDHLNAQLKLRFCPRLTFQADESIDRAMKIDQILHDLGKKKSE